jgi:endonuclease/exonuclease/phosphatase family metal-dependent hydrolase
VYGRSGVRVLTWNLFHGRSVPAAGRGLLNAFAARLDGWAWDVALLQEVPPWWPPLLARACGAEPRAVLTSRNALLCLRRAIASRDPDLLKANGGGCNAILVRGGGIEEHRTVRLTWLPERRWAHGVRLASGLWAVNLHASTRGAAGEPQTRAESRRAAGTALGWAGGAPLVFGGDLNLLGRPELPGLRHVAGHYVDRVYVSRIEPAGSGEVLDRGTLSDHAPVAVDLAVP